MTIRILLILLTLFSFDLSAQEKPSLSLMDYYQMVGEYHPVAKQAILLKTQGKYVVREARGAFDPKLVSSYDTKDFDSKAYYDIWDSYLKIPTLLNIDIKAGYERNNGIFLNPENTVPTDGLYYMGISVPLGQGLISNARTIGLKKSKLSQQELEIEAITVMNNLFLDANYAFWNWYESYQKKELIRGNINLIQERFEGIRQSVLNGEKAAIDSIETLIQVQQWSNNLGKASVNFDNSVLLLKNFVWGDTANLSILIPDTLQEMADYELNYYIDYGSTNHPSLQKLRIKNSSLVLDRRLGAEQLKPILNVNYNILLRNQNPNNASGILNNDYKAGFDFSFPLFIRKERAKLSMIKLKQQNNDYEISQKRREVINKINQAHNKITLLHSMIIQQKNIVINYNKMLEGERARFNNGESSIFLINSRENKKIKAEMKLIEISAAYYKNVAFLKWSSGFLAEEIRNMN